MDEINQLKQRIGELESFVESLKTMWSFPREVNNAIKANIASLEGLLVTSTKSSSSENKAVNEGGVANYSVLTTPDGFLQVTIGTTVYYLPYFN